MLTVRKVGSIIEKLKEMLEEYLKKVHVVDENGNNMLLKGLDVKKALELN